MVAEALESTVVKKNESTRSASSVRDELLAQHINQYYGLSHTIRDMSVSVSPGECVVLMGRNGVGKTTFLKSLMGLVPVASGEMIFAGEQFIEKPVEIRAQNGIGYVPQGRQIFPLLTVEENLKTGLAVRRGQTREIPSKIFDLFPVLHEMRSRRGGDLSGGQQQQLAIGRALVIEPRMLLLDEPSEGIQPNIVSQIGEVIQLLTKEQGLGVLLVEQKLPFARRFGDRFILMDRGSSVARGSMGELTEDLVSEHLSV